MYMMYDKLNLQPSSVSENNKGDMISKNHFQDFKSTNESKKNTKVGFLFGSFCLFSISFFCVFIITAKYEKVDFLLHE